MMIRTRGLTIVSCSGSTTFRTVMSTSGTILRPLHHARSVPKNAPISIQMTPAMIFSHSGLIWSTPGMTASLAYLGVIFKMMN
jgi:hypothetical protein